MVVTEDGDMIARSGKALKFIAKKKHNMAKVSKKMKLPPKNTPSNKITSLKLFVKRSYVIKKRGSNELHFFFP